MAEVTLRRSKTSTHEFGISMPKKTIDRINTVKGPYISRAKFILRAVDKALQEEEQREKEEETSAQCVTDWVGTVIVG
jgi:metal-responsive CopG/Arc/MetJ family transcriptional regulator